MLVLCSAPVLSVPVPRHPVLGVGVDDGQVVDGWMDRWVDENSFLSLAPPTVLKVLSPPPYRWPLPTHSPRVSAAVCHC